MPSRGLCSVNTTRSVQLTFTRLAMQVVNMEGKVLRKLCFEVPTATALDVFHNVMDTYAKPPFLVLDTPYDEAFCLYLFHLSIYEGIFLEFGAEVCAVAVLELATHCARKRWPAVLQHELSLKTGITAHQMQRCVRAVHSTWWTAHRSPLQAIAQLHPLQATIKPPDFAWGGFESSSDASPFLLPLNVETAVGVTSMTVSS